MRIPHTTLLAVASAGGAVGAALVVALVFLTRGTVAPAVAEPVERAATFASWSDAPDDFRLAARRSMAGVVHISTLEERPTTVWDFYYGRGPQVREGTGSGVIYRADGYIVTNHHVVDGAQRISVTLDDNRRFRAKLVGSYPEADIAVLKIDAAELPALAFGDSEDVEVGDWVLAVGNPYELSSTVTAGILSARGRDIDIIDRRGALESFLQTDAAINPGNSGGALVDTRGEVIGINTAIYSRSGGYAGYGFAIPANLVARIADDLIETGTYRQVRLGIDASELTAEYAAELGLAVTQGVLIAEVAPGSIAEAGDLRPRDVVVGAGGRPVRSIAEFREAVTSRRPGSELDVVVLRAGERVGLVLVL